MNAIERFALTVDVAPEVEPVRISHERCPVHNFRFVGMPRDKGGDSLNYVCKCPLRVCAEGIMKPRTDD